MNRHFWRACDRGAGFSLVELLVTIIIAGVAFGAMVPFLASAQSRNAADNMRNVALQVARDKVEKIRQLDYDSVDAAYLNTSGPPVSPGGIFGTEWTAGTGGAQKTLRITYVVSPVPSTAQSGQEHYKLVSVSVVWDGAPFPHKAVVLQTTISRQYFGPQVVDLNSPDASAGTEGLGRDQHGRERQAHRNGRSTGPLTDDGFAAG